MNWKLETNHQLGSIKWKNFPKISLAKIDFWPRLHVVTLPCCSETKWSPSIGQFSNERHFLVSYSFTTISFRYPHKGEYLIFKVFTWVSGALFGLVVGKVFVHGFLLNGIFQMKLFRRNQGSWVVMFLTMIMMLYCFSLIFNHITKLDPELTRFYITNQMGIKYKTFMNGVGLTSFFSHVLFSLMVTDAIFQVMIDNSFVFYKSSKNCQKQETTELSSLNIVSATEQK